jgi:hypothetical protein
VCNENPLAPLISYLGLRLYRTSDDNSVLYDHDLERYYLLFSRTCKILFPCYFVLAPHCVCWSLCSYALFDKDGNQVPKETVDKVGETFERILEEVHSELIHALYFFLYFLKSISSSLYGICCITDGESARWAGTRHATATGNFYCVWEAPPSKVFFSCTTLDIIHEICSWDRLYWYACHFVGLKG